MDLAGICEVLQATQHAEGSARKAAEQKLDTAVSESPAELVRALQGVLAAGDSIGIELRQESAVILRQLILGSTGKAPVWEILDEVTRSGLLKQLLITMEQDSATLAKRSAGQVAAVIAEKIAEDFDQLVTAWPEMLPSLSRLVAAPCDNATRIVALGVLKDLAGTIGDGLLAKGGSVTLAMLRSTIEDRSSELSSAGMQLVLALIEKLEMEDTVCLGDLMPALIVRLQQFANDFAEEPLRDTLIALCSAIEEEPDFFRDYGLDALWATLVKLCETTTDTFADPSVRHQAMEAATTLAVGLSEDHFSKPEGLPKLEKIVALNLTWMFDVEENVETWTEDGRHTDEDTLDGDGVRIGEENLDQLAEYFDETVFMPIVFETIRAALASADASWKHMRAAVVMVSQVVEHIEEDMAYVDQCLDFLARYFTNAHPRVRHAAFMAAGQVCYDHSDHVASGGQKVLLPALIAGMQDENIRVATTAVNSFGALAEELDIDDLEEFMEPAMGVLFDRLQSKSSRIMREHCLSAITAIAEIAEEEFVMYYDKVMPLLKAVISEATTEEERSLRGKAFLCVSLIGSAVGKEAFSKDAHVVMEAMMKVSQAGFADDDPQKESIQEASGKIAALLGKDFKGYVPGMLPSIFSLLDQRPAEVDDEDDKDMSLAVVSGKVMGLRTSLLLEMEGAVEQMITFVKALEDDFSEFMQPTCQHLLPLLDFQLSDDLRDKAYELSEVLVECARTCLNMGKLDMNSMRGFVGEFLKKVVGSMASTPVGDAFDESACGVLQSQAIGLSGLIGKAGEGVLTGDVLKDVALVVGKLLGELRCGKDAEAMPGMRRRKGVIVRDEDREDDDDLDEMSTAQTACFCLADAIHALMVSNCDAFAETVLPSLMVLVQSLMQTGSSDPCRSLAFYIADDVVDVMGEKSLPHWNWLMNAALSGGTDQCAVVRQFAVSTMGNASRVKAFAPMATASAGQICSVLSKQGERHRRRRAVKADTKQNALAVDACIRALGLICEHQEETLGTHAATGWSVWLDNLPMRYDGDGAQKAHAQLLSLLARRHPALLTPEKQVKFMGVIADVYKSPTLSNSCLDKSIVLAVGQIGEAPITQLTTGFSEARQKKIEQMLKAAAKDVVS